MPTLISEAGSVIQMKECACPFTRPLRVCCPFLILRVCWSSSYYKLGKDQLQKASRSWNMRGALKNVCSIWSFSEKIQVPMLHTHTVPPEFLGKNKTHLHCLVRRLLVLTRRNSFRPTGSGLDRARVANVTRSVRGFFSFGGVCFPSLLLVVQIRG